MPVEVQKLSNVFDVNSLAPSTRSVFMGLFGNWAHNFKRVASNRAKTRFIVDSSNTWGHFNDESIIAKKNLNGPLFGSVGLHTSSRPFDVRS
jgi:hypothetical protein